MKYLLLCSFLLLFFLGEAKSSSTSPLAPSITLGFNTPEILGRAPEQTCSHMILQAIRSVKENQTAAKAEGTSKQCYIKAMLYSFNDPFIISALRGALGEGVNIELMLDREQLAKSINEPYNESRNSFLKDISLTIIGTPYEAGSNKRVLHQKASLFYCMDGSALTHSTIMLGSYNWTYGAAHYNFENCVAIDNPGTLFDSLHGQFQSLNDLAPSDPLPPDQVDPDVKKYPPGVDFIDDPAIAGAIAKAFAVEGGKRARAGSSSGGGSGFEGGAPVISEADWIIPEKWNISADDGGKHRYRRDFSGGTVTVFFKYGKWKYVYKGNFGSNFDSLEEAMRQSYLDLVRSGK